MRVFRTHTKLNLGFTAAMVAGIAYLVLLTLFNTSAPFMVVRGASMQPTYHQGDLLLSRGVAPTDVEIGDVIVFAPPRDALGREAGFRPITVHRVYGIGSEDGHLVFMTRGDNGDVDLFNVPSQSVKGVVSVNLGPVGHPILWITNQKFWLYVGSPALVFAVIASATYLLTTNRGDNVPQIKEDQVPGLRSGPVEPWIEELAQSSNPLGPHLKPYQAVLSNLEHAIEELRRVTEDPASNDGDLRRAIFKHDYALAKLNVIVSVPSSESQPELHSKVGPDRAPILTSSQFSVDGIPAAEASNANSGAPEEAGPDAQSEAPPSPGQDSAWSEPGLIVENVPT